MIPKDEIKSKDFSCAIPEIVSKLTAVSESLKAFDEEDYEYHAVHEAIKGHGIILEDAIRDLHTINKELYWSDEKATEATNPD